MNSPDQEIPVGQLPSVGVDRFLPLLTANHHRVYGYILSQVPVRSDADDLMQEATLVMWRRFEDFRLNSDFAAWGIAVARNLIRNYRRNRYRAVMHLSDKALEAIEARGERFERDLDQRMDALRQCVAKLDEEDRTLLRLRYEGEAPVKVIAQRLGKDVQVTYKLLGRIRTMLARCVRRTLAVEGI